MSGIEALYWAQQYPEEVAGIIGLDMAVPLAYEDMKISMPILKMTSFISKIGITRFIPNIASGEAVKNGTLTDDEKELYRAIFYRKTASVAMINEAEEIKSNAAIVNDGKAIEIPMLLFVSNGTGGTGYDEGTWRKFQQDYIANNSNAKLIELDCPHYVHNYEYIRISEEILDFFEYEIK